MLSLGRKSAGPEKSRNERVRSSKMANWKGSVSKKGEMIGFGHNDPVFFTSNRPNEQGLGLNDVVRFS